MLVSGLYERICNHFDDNLPLPARHQWSIASFSVNYAIYEFARQNVWLLSTTHSSQSADDKVSSCLCIVKRIARAAAHFEDISSWMVVVTKSRGHLAPTTAHNEQTEHWRDFAQIEARAQWYGQHFGSFDFFHFGSGFNTTAFDITANSYHHCLKICDT